MGIREMPQRQNERREEDLTVHQSLGKKNIIKQERIHTMVVMGTDVYVKRLRFSYVLGC
jgi:hypothetical protein